jgi:hypothetical protein
MEDNQIDKVQSRGWRGRRSSAAFSTARWAICELWSQQRSSLSGLSAKADQQVDPNDRQEESMCSVLLIRHYEEREQLTGVPWFVTQGLQGEILETRARPAKLRRPGLVMMLALPGLVFLAGGAMASAQEFSRPILSSGLHDATHVQTQSIAKPVQSPLIKSPTGAANLPPIGSIGAGSDIRPFLAPGVPAHLTRAALRRAWSTDPAIRDFIGLSENSWDFNAPDGVPGFGSLTPQRLARMNGKAESSDTERGVPVPTQRPYGYPVLPKSNDGKQSVSP